MLPWIGIGSERRRKVNEHDQQIAGISKSMAMMCVRNTLLEDIHAGIELVNHTKVRGQMGQKR